MLEYKAFRRQDCLGIHDWTIGKGFIMTQRYIKTLQNGWQVPYPGELRYKNLLCLKDYQLNADPKDDSGNYMPSISCGDYDDWLQDYLYHCDIELTDEQEKIRKHIQENPKCTAGFLGGEAGFYEGVGGLRPFYLFLDDFETELNIESLQGSVYDDPYADYLAGISEDVDEKPLSKLEYVLEDYGWHIVKQQEAKDFSLYWPDFEKFGMVMLLTGVGKDELVEMPDFGWRVYLSFYLKRYDDRERRITELTRFMDEYCDAVHK